MNAGLPLLLVCLVLGAALFLFLFLAVRSVLARPSSEAATGRLVPLTLLLALAASLGLSWAMFANDTQRLELSLGAMVSLEGYRFEFCLLADWLSLPYLTLTLLLCGVTGRFAHNYLHREGGYNRFFVLYALFVAGMVVSVLAGSIETLIAGWELVGLSSVLLIGFFHERPEPVRNALRVWAVYRIGDLGLLFAGVYAHHWAGTGSFAALFGSRPALPSEGALLALGLLLLLAAMGKSALLPFSNWLPRAMEGPTPSSAIFYGALSVHLGAFLLLRAGSLLEASPLLAGVTAALGAATALFASAVGRVQTDIKSALAYASLTQVGIIVAEIGCGLRLVPLMHLLGHACLRTLQFLRAPSLLHDLHRVESAMGRHLPRTGIHWERLLPEAARARLYRAALERGYLEALLREGVARPFLAAAALCDSLEERWVRALGGGAKR